ncbi:universal stress protein [Saliphagus sp. LR7]|uniref:universal stress protein n=1 Tax=Saliphagus sp. LR7 TaxID=2282654 RepID=UPI0018E59BA6|nr:universal stress protein [Saliphagus sp. LR7]
MFDQVLIAVDESDHSRRAAMVGLAFATAYGADIDVVHAVEDASSTTSTETGTRDHQGADDILQDISERATDVGVTVETHAVEGNPPEVIVNQANESNADLIVMGRQGRSGISEQVLGSVTDRVLRNTDVPVLVVPSGEPVSSDGSRFDRILAPTDGSETAEQAAPYSTDIAKHHDATLHVLNVIDPRFEGIFSAGGGSEEFFERLEERGHDFIDQYIEHGGQTTTETPTDVDIRKAVVRGTTSEEIDEYAVENDIDLVVMASQGESGLTGQLLGSIADQTLRESEKPVLIIPSTE